MKRRKMDDTRTTKKSSQGYYKNNESLAISRTKESHRKWTHYVDNSHQRLTFRVVSFNVLAGTFVVLIFLSCHLRVNLFHF
jgi:hypothetical protein